MMATYKYITTFSNFEKPNLNIFEWKLTGYYSDTLRIKFHLFKGIEVYRNDQEYLRVNTDVYYENEYIGKAPKFWWMIFKGYSGKYESRNGFFKIKNKRKKLLSLILNDEEIGIIDYQNYEKNLTFSYNCEITQPDLFIMAWELWRLMNTDFD